MSLILDRSGGIAVKTFPSVINPKVYFGDHVVDLEDFVEAMKYVLTNSDLLDGDPRIQFMTWCAKLAVVDGFNPNALRLKAE